MCEFPLYLYQNIFISPQNKDTYVRIKNSKILKFYLGKDNGYPYLVKISKNILKSRTYEGNVLS